MKKLSTIFAEAAVVLVLALIPVFSFAQQAVSATPNTLVLHLQGSTNPHVSPYAYTLSTAIWPSRRIYVCWDNPAPQYAEEMKIVQQAVRETWEKVSALSFEGWSTCAKHNQGIRITIADMGPYTRGLGKQLQVDGPGGNPKGHAPGGMVLNFTFKNWNPDCAVPDRRAMCIRSIAIHEFGHAIGFAHEHNRPDKPGECTEKPQGGNGDTQLTSYDKESVMNYCFNIYNPDLRLSKLDISAVRQLYGSEADK